MKNVCAILSMLHEPATRNSATRLFRGGPVLAWTLRRLARSTRIGPVATLCWVDQEAAIRAVAGSGETTVVAHGPRRRVPEIESVSAARRWADGWRGGLNAACHFDLGFYAPWHEETVRQLDGDALVLIDPSAGLTDPALIDAMVEHAAANDSLEFCFTPAAPGFGSVLLKPALLARLSAARTHPGRLMHYHPDQVSREPLAETSCAPTPTVVARTLGRFTFDSDRQITRLQSATRSLNGQLPTARAEEIVKLAAGTYDADPMPREIVLELNTRRATRPVYWPGRHLEIRRTPIALKEFRALIDELAPFDDTRLTLGGVGDPLLSDDAIEIVNAAAAAGLAVNVETDLLDVPADRLRELGQSGSDVISVHLPATTATTYHRVMGVDRCAAVLENLKTLILARQERRSGTPLVAPVFYKCRDNFGEMEAWYDQWLRAVGSAVIRGPDTFAGQVPDVSVADMSPPRRTPCVRLRSRLTILCDGSIVSCEQDVLGIRPLGRIGTDPIGRVWQECAGKLRKEHDCGRWGETPLCGNCRDWHRP